MFNICDYKLKIKKLNELWMNISIIQNFNLTVEYQKTVMYNPYFGTGEKPIKVVEKYKTIVIKRAISRAFSSGWINYINKKNNLDYLSDHMRATRIFSDRIIFSNNLVKNNKNELDIDIKDLICLYDLRQNFKAINNLLSESKILFNDFIKNKKAI